MFQKISKTLAKELKEELRILEYKQSLKCFQNEDYLKFKLRPEEMYKIKANFVKLRSKFDQYTYREKFSKFFLNLVQSQIRKLIIEEKELTEQNEIKNNIFTFCQNLFSKQTDFDELSKEPFEVLWDDVKIP